MAKYFRYFETQAEFESAYTGEEYVEPFVAYIEENQGVVFDKVSLMGLKLKNVRVLADVPASGGTVTEADCSYTVLAVYDDFSNIDVTQDASVSGSLVVNSSMIEQRHSAGTLTLTAEYSGLSAMSEVKVYQEAFIPSVTAITIDNLTWVNDIPASGGTATKDNCSYSVTAIYDNGNEVDVTDEAVVTGSLVVEESELAERRSAGTLTLTATYSGFNDSDSVTVWQEAATSYLTFNITSGGDISWSCIGESAATIEYKKNDGEWAQITALPLDPGTMTGGAKINVVAGDKVQFRGDNATYADLNGGLNYGTFALSTAGFTLEGNIMSLIDSVNYKEITGMTNDNAGAFATLFVMCAGLTSAENLVLPATTLANSCYQSMFQVCSSLTTAPELPATTLAQGCYGGMFYGCTSLTTAPELPATTLAEGCYQYMFAGCTSLTTAPELPATTLAEGCYSDMFQGCTPLNYIKCLATDISASNCTNNWVNGVASTGTFIGVEGNPAGWDWGTNGVPEFWQNNLGLQQEI